jgi:hypothetical protein
MLVLRFSSYLSFLSSVFTSQKQQKDARMTMSKSNAAYDTLISFQDKLTHLNGVITLDAIDKLKDELGRIFTVTKTHHYKQGQKYGHLASAILEPKYRLAIRNAAWAHTVPGNPDAYSQAALDVSNSATLREQQVAEHKILQKSYNDYLGVKEAGKELILYAVGDNVLAPLKKLYIGFRDSTVLKMINHLCLKMAIKMTMAQKHEYKTMGYNNPWDLTTSITAYFTQLNRFQVSLGDCRITTSKAEKTMAAGAQMWQCKMFMEDPMVAWENKTAAQQTWTVLQIYFTKKMAGTQAIFCDDGKTIKIQRGNAAHPRDSSSRGGRRVTGNALWDATGATRQANCCDGSNKQGQHGCNDGEDECSRGRWRQQTDNPTGQ